MSQEELHISGPEIKFSVRKALPLHPHPREESKDLGEDVLSVHAGRPRAVPLEKLALLATRGALQDRGLTFANMINYVQML